MGLYSELFAMQLIS